MPRTHFQCILCFEDKFEAYPRWIGHSRICDACADEAVKPLFHAALEHEYQYPPMWGKEKLDIWTFWDLLDDDFQVAWKEKEKEYAMPVKKRLYCESRDNARGTVCGRFLGQKGLGLIRCSRCQCHTCRGCGITTSGSKSHACKDIARNNALEKFVRGRHYQQCPGCEKEIFQAEGCNHMICRRPCSSHFCFTCGKRVAAHRSGHWQKGGCPRFGVSGPRRIWDNPDEHSEDEADASDNDGGAMDLFDQLRDVRRVERMIDIFDHAADAERLESNRARITRGVPSLVGEHRIRFFGYVLTNLATVLDVMHTRFDVDHVAELLREFNDRHQRIHHEYGLSKGAGPQPGTVTQLSDLSDEFDAYFVFAVETIADLSVIADAQRRTL